jgi:predicted enzyme related to lactoylglutathione lyase
VRASGLPFLGLSLGRGLDDGQVLVPEALQEGPGLGQRPPSWLPYVEVGDVRQATERATRLGAAVLLTPREGPQGWRSVVTTPAAGDLAFWQPGPRRHP